MMKRCKDCLMCDPDTSFQSTPWGKCECCGDDIGMGPNCPKRQRRKEQAIGGPITPPMTGWNRSKFLSEGVN